MTRIVVTGGNGHVGEYLLRHLADHDYHTVNVSRGRRQEDVADEYVRADLTNAGDVHGAFAKADPDVVVHLGMIPTPTSNPGHETFRSNSQSTYGVLGAAEAQGIDRVVLASSLCAIGAGYERNPNDPAYLPLDEESPPRPSNPYGLGKQTLEVIADGFGRRDGPPSSIVSLRFPWVTNEADIRETFVDPDRSLDALRVTDGLWDARQTYFTYLHMEDAVSAVRSSLHAAIEGHERIFLNAPDSTVLDETREVVAECYPDAAVRSELSGHDSLVETSKAAALLDWRAERSWRDYE